MDSDRSEPQKKPTPDDARPDTARAPAAPADAAQSRRIVAAVYAAIAEINLLRPADSRLAQDLDTDLSSLDSMNLVSLIVQTEEQLEDHLGMTVNLTDPATSGLEAFSSVRRYVSRIEAIIAEQQR